MKNETFVWTQHDEDELKETQKDCQYFKRYDRSNLKKMLEAVEINGYIAASI